MVLLGMMNLNTESKRRILSSEAKVWIKKKNIRNEYHCEYLLSFLIILLVET